MFASIAPMSKAAKADDAPPDQAPGEKALVRRILEHLRERRFEPGERLPSERILAAKFGVGRNALREALATLITLRVVEARPNSGIYLRRYTSESSFDALVLLSQMGTPPTPEEVVETVEVRRALELEATRLACKRRTATDLEALHAILDSMDELLERGGNVADLDQAFHVALVEAAHNSVLLRVLNSFYALTLERRRAYFGDAKLGRDSAQMHRRIVRAIEARDEAAAAKLVARHLENAKVYWGEVFGAAAL